MKKTILLLGLWSALLSAQSLYTDIKARQVGDVLSVMIVESADALRESKSASNQSSSMDVGARTSGNVTSFLPLFGASSNLATAFKDDDGTRQKDKLNGRMTVRIVEVTANGMYKIEGERTINVNGEENVMSLTGFVRPRDITTGNAVYSYNVADAEIIYKKGGITNLVNDGFFSNTFTRVIGLGMIAAALGYLSLK
ncbi:MAG: flagellar basal body L-ring protein FlgH [Calditrichaeota bacterium]|nr:MAG: flagellar basal body L-ring protein FlgH [Calditrichota bacterium]